MMTTEKTTKAETGPNSKRRARGKRTPYAVYYRDGAYMIYDLTKSDFEALRSALTQKHGGICTGIELSVGILVTDDIRAVIEQKPIQPDTEKPADPPMTMDERAWIYGKEEDESDGI